MATDRFTCNLEDSRVALRDQRWSFMVEIDESEVKEEWDRYRLDVALAHEQGQSISIHGVDNVERLRWEKARVMRGHLAEFTQLARAAEQYVTAFFGAGGQDLLATRAGLAPLEIAARPTPAVHYTTPLPPNNLPVHFVDLVNELGGPQVLGAKLLWWLNAAAVPLKFGVAGNLFHRLWNLPIWTTGLSEGRSKSSRTMIDAPRTLVGGSTNQAIDLIQQAAVDLCDLLENQLKVGRPIVSAEADVSPTANSIHLAGGLCTIVFNGRKTVHKTLVGMRHLARLLAAPDDKLYVLELFTRGSVGAKTLPAQLSGDTAQISGRLADNIEQEIVDVEALRKCRSRLTELDADLERAERDHDRAEIDRLQSERQQLIGYVGGMLDQDGHRRQFTSGIDKARKAVSNAINASIARIGEQDKLLATHLTRAIRLGRSCVYAPHTPTRWNVQF